MNEKQIKSLISLITLLYQQKYPKLAIAVLAVVLLFVSYDWIRKTWFPPPPDHCEVLKIYDGDTMTLQCPGQSEKTKVRMYCIDTPEMKQKPWGTQARDHLRAIAGKMVQLVEVDKDRYGRVVGEVYSNDINLNIAQVKAGYAAVDKAYCKKSEYDSVENEAKQAKLGIWSQSGIQQTPWEWRKQQRK